MIIEGPASAVARMSNLICCCSIASAACLWYIELLPHSIWYCFILSCSCFCWGLLFKVLPSASRARLCHACCDNATVADDKAHQRGKPVDMDGRGDAEASSRLGLLSVLLLFEVYSVYSLRFQLVVSLVFSFCHACWDVLFRVLTSASRARLCHVFCDNVTRLQCRGMFTMTSYP